MEFITFNSPWEKINTMNLLEKYTKIAGCINYPYIVVVPNPRPDHLSAQEIFEESVGVLREISEMLAASRVRFAFGFLGFDWCSVITLP